MDCANSFESGFPFHLLPKDLLSLVLSLSSPQVYEISQLCLISKFFADYFHLELWTEKRWWKMTRSLDLSERPLADQNAKLSSRTNLSLLALKNQYQANRHKKLGSLKIVVLGSGGVGKTSYVRSLSQCSFEPRYIATCGVLVSSFDCVTSEGTIEIVLWDPAGPEKYGGLRDGYYIGGHGAILMFDITHRSSYREIPVWHRDVLRVCGPDLCAVLCSTKHDLPKSSHRIEPKHITYPKKKDIPYFPISSRNGECLVLPIQSIVNAKGFPGPVILYPNPMSLDDIPPIEALGPRSKIEANYNDHLQAVTSTWTPRIRNAIIPLLQGVKTRFPGQPNQNPTWLLVPELRATPWHPFVSQQGFWQVGGAPPDSPPLPLPPSEVILHELYESYDQANRQLISSEVEQGRWEVIHILEEGLPTPNSKLFPETCRWLFNLPNLFSRCSFGYAYFSIVGPHTKLSTHCGPTNLRLRCHLPLVLPTDTSTPCYLSVAGEKRPWDPREIMIFDDSFDHFMVNETNETRIVLLFDIWHPDLTQQEIVNLREFQL